MKIAIILDNYERSHKLIDKLPPNDFIFELRLDCDEKLIDLIKNNIIDKNTAIITYRSKTDGGSLPKSCDRELLLQKSIKFNTKYLDLEFDNDQNFIAKIIKNYLLDSEPIPIISRHDYRDSMENAAIKYLQDIEKSSLMKFKEKFVLKFVGKPIDALDTIIAVNKLTENFPRHVILGIGENGKISRTLATKLNQEFVFGALQKGLPIMYYKDLFDLNQFDKSEPIFTGLVGKSLKHSLSPVIHDLLCTNENLNGYYHLLEITNDQRVKPLIKELRKYFRGINVTFPYKQTVLNFADHISNDAIVTNASNTLVFQNDKIFAENTDVSGFTIFLETHKLDKSSSALIFGAGGASRAVAAALLEKGIEIFIVNRSKARFLEFSDTLRDQINFILLKDYKENLKSDLYINATSIGFDGTDPTKLLPLPKYIENAIDLVYSKNETGLVKAAKKRNIPVYDGKEMLFHQAVDSFELWTKSRVNRSKIFTLFSDSYER